MLAVTKNRTKCVGGLAIGEFYSLAKGFGPFLRGFWAGFREREGSIFSNHQHFAVSTGICGVACPLLLYALGSTSLLPTFRNLVILSLI